jgi:hypothetical protein
MEMQDGVWRNIDSETFESIGTELNLTELPNQVPFEENWELDHVLQTDY